MALWKAAEAEAATIMVRERLRIAEAIAAERELRQKALGMVDARDAFIEAQLSEIAWFVDELERPKVHVAMVKARAFWRTVAQEIWNILPEREAMHLGDIAKRIGHEFGKEAEDHPGEWGPELLRGVIDQRINFKKLFASDGSGRYRRRRPEDDVAA
ncbi:hypothetical protein [Methylobacterium sp. WL8]|uniref:hypothetical protein n=1 Tax=Methylobacterium sp. WL8 TaxID=2603899 RepID=UPI0011CCAC49|nr:hypothetical protein [Methylobacterium sp. WL8]TXN81512.1 hypothetical protein FV234_13345 [Methylobacterium sp. WL8]